MGEKMSESKNNEWMNSIELSDAISVAGSGFYCNGTSHAAKVAGNFGINNANGANYIQVRIGYNPGDATQYLLTYKLNGQQSSFTFTPQNTIMQKNGSFTDFSCQLVVESDKGDGNTFCSIGVFKV